jgi:hypothetical protein
VIVQFQAGEDLDPVLCLPVQIHLRQLAAQIRDVEYLNRSVIVAARQVRAVGGEREVANCA